jgi:hypothetical protein
VNGSNAIIVLFGFVFVGLLATTIAALLQKAFAMTSAAAMCPRRKCLEKNVIGARFCRRCGAALLAVRRTP